MRALCLLIGLAGTPVAWGAPAAVTDLAATPGAQVILSWTAPNPQANLYDIRWSTAGPVTSGNFASASALGAAISGYAISPTIAPPPSAPGAAQTLTVTGLKPRQAFYWALKSSADGGTTWSAIDSTSTRPSATASAFVLAASGLPAGNPPVQVALADYDNDGRLDILGGYPFGGGQGASVLHNNGNFSFSTSHPSNDLTNQMVWADFDNDGLPDFVEANVSLPIKVYRNNGSGSFALVWTSTDVAIAVAAADWDNDGKIDIVALLPNGTAKAYRNNGDGTFTNVWVSTETTLEGTISAADFDGDGRTDFIVGNHPSAHVFTLYRNQGGSSFAAGWSSPALGQFTGVLLLGDYNNDGRIDVVTRVSGGVYRAWSNNGDGTFTGTWTATLNTGVGHAVAFADYDQDGWIDILVSLATAGSAILLNNGDGTFSAPQPLTPADPNTLGEAVAAGDLDGDGFFDVVETNTNGSTKLRVFKSLDGAFAAQVSTPAPPAALSASLIPGGTVQLTWPFGNYEASFSSRSFYFQAAAATCPSSPCMILDATGARVTSPSTFLLSPAYGSPLLGNLSRPLVAPGQPGLRLDFNSLTENVTYYFRVATIDAGLRRSSWSSETSIYVSEPPSTIVDLSTGAAVSDTQAVLRWTAPGNNGRSGSASSYDIRYSTLPLDASSFAQATAWNSARLVAGPSGTAESETISSLSPAATYYFAMTARDAVGNVSGLSNVVSCVTGGNLAPVVLGLTPADGAAGVAASTAVAVRFNKTMGAASLSSGVSLVAVQDNFGAAVSQLVAGATSYSGQTFALTPSVPLAKNYVYEVRVSTACRDPLGNPLTSSATARFVTVFDHTVANAVQAGAGFQFSIAAGAFPFDGTLTASTGTASAAAQLATQKLSASDALRRPILTFQAQAVDGTGALMEPSGAVTVSVPYSDVNHDGIVDGTDPPVRAKSLKVWLLDDALALWQPLPTSSTDPSSSRVSATLPHFSTYALIGQSDGDLSDAYAFPVPFRPSLGHATINFVGLAQPTRLRIYNIASGLVFETSADSADGRFQWDVRNRSGADVASGVYFYVLESSRQKKTGKLIIIR